MSKLRAFKHPRRLKRLGIYENWVPVCLREKRRPDSTCDACKEYKKFRAPSTRNEK